MHQYIRQCQQLSRLAGEPQCMSLEGVTGAGKSTLVQDYARAFPRVLSAGGMQIPVFYMETPSPVTVKGMAAAMLAQLGDPAAYRGTLWSLNSRLIKLLVACEVEIAILDDFHHLVDSETNQVLAKVSEWLKVLIKETGLPFLVVGIKGPVERILDTNSQLSRLFAARETLEPFPWDLADEAGLQEFAQFVQYAQEAIGMPLPSALPRTELLYRLHYATEGVVGNLMNLLRYATMLAQEQGAETLQLPTLALAFQRRLAKHLKGRVNLFAEDQETPFAAPALHPAVQTAGTPSSCRKKRAPSIGATLRTR